MYLRPTLLATLAAGSLVGPATALPVYTTDFEASQGFNAGAFPTTDPLWTVQADPVTVEASGGQPGQFVRLGAGAILDFALTQPVSDVVWVEGYFRGQGSSQSLGDPDVINSYPVSAASAIVHFSTSQGIEGWNGLTNQPVQLQASIDPAVWYRLTVQLDFVDKTWDLWINNTKATSSSLGFRDNTVTALNGFKNLAQNGADFDAFRVVCQLLGDANGDSIVDSADIVKLVEFVTAPPSSDPIVFGNADIPDANRQTDGVINNDDVTRLWARLLDAI